MSAIRAIIFDIGGVLVPLPPADRFARWESQCGLAPGRFAWTVWQLEVADLAMRGHVSTADLWQQVARQFGLRGTDVKEIVEIFWRYETYDRSVARMIGSLRTRYRTALLSNAWPGAREQITAAGLIDLSDHLILSCEEGVAKPDRQIYLTTLDRLNVRPDRTLFVDDVAENLATARELGMATFHFADAARDLSRLAALLAEQR